MLFKAAILAVLIIMAIALFQLFVQIRTEGTIDVNIGYPFRFFFFTIDGDALQGSYPIGFIWNFIIIFPITFLSSLIRDYFFTRTLSRFTKENDLVDQ
jgi:hypothetical protein